MRKIILVIGKGGVGKTTISILISLCLSKVGRTLVYSLDPAKHLIKYLGVNEVMKYISVLSNLTAYQLDINVALSKALDHYVSIIRDLMPSLSVLNLDDVANAIKYSPGVEEEIFMKELLRMYSTTEFKYVVVDTPPTGITLRTLVMPRLYKIWLDKLVEIRERIVTLRYTIARTLGRDIKSEDPALRRLYELRKDYSTLWENLRSNDTSYTLVANPELMPLMEVNDVINFLGKELNVRPKLLVMNKYVISNSNADVIKLFNELPYSKVVVPKVEPPPSDLGRIMELLNYIDVEFVLRVLS